MRILYCIAILFGIISLATAGLTGAFGVIVGLILAGGGAFMLYRSAKQKKHTAVQFVRSYNSDTFHRPSCKAVRMIDKTNLQIFEGQTAAYLRSIGLKPCAKCNPR